MSPLPESCELQITGQTTLLPVCKAGETYFGPYRLLRMLGKGGMGEVYLAEDVRLGREIALKMLPEQFTQYANRVQRFVREARAASALNHPNIITIFDIGEANGKHYIVSEYIRGQTLRQQMATPMTIAMALDVGIQMASALNAAHEAGIVHRDIKPENIMLRPDGLVKVLDFGIAKLVERGSPAVPADSDNQSATAPNKNTTKIDPYLTISEAKSEGTAPGIILGTVTYMSPEQLRGQKIDARSDIFSLGIVLYEAIVGTPPFIGQTQADRIAAILEHEPMPMVDNRPDVPPELEQIIGTALCKDRDFRYQYIKEMLTDLKELEEELEFQEKLERSAQSELRDQLEATKATRRQGWRLLAKSAAVAVIIAALIVAGLYWRSHRDVPLTDKDTVVLADFTNTTGDPIFDGTLRQSLASQLEQSPFLKLLSDDRIVQTLSLMGKPRDARLTHQVAREVCQRTASRATIEGVISGLGNQYELHLKAVDSRSSDAFVEIRATAHGKEQVLRELSKAATKLREKLGESLASVQKYDVPAENVTTGSLEALQAYSLGYRTMNVDADYKSAIPFFEKAAGLDPNLAMAYALLATSYGNNGDRIRAAENAHKAFELRQRVSERERFYIESAYEYHVTNNLEATRRVYELWAEIYPRDHVPPNNLGNIYSILGEYEKALSAYQQSMRLDPGSGICYENLLSVYIKLNRLDEAKATILEAQAHNLNFLNLHRGLYLIYFLQNDSAGMEHEASLMINKPGWVSTAFYLESETAAYRGQFFRARELARRAVEDLRRTGRNEAAADNMAQAALRETLAGNFALAKQQAEEALSLSDNKSVQAMSATVLGLAGDSVKATRMAVDLAQRSPENTIIQLYYLPMIRGAVAMQEGNSAKAVGAFAMGAPCEMGSVGYIQLYPVYLRGQAHLSARQERAAAAEFRKILDRPGLVGNRLIGALAHLGLGRAYAMAGDSAKARTAYQDFLMLWKDADQDTPILKQARAEYAQLD